MVRAPQGLRDQPGGRYPGPAVAEWPVRFPGLTASEVPGVNHCTIVMAEPGSSAVVVTVTTAG